MFRGEANDGIHDFLTDARPTGISLATGIELLRDQFPVPAKDRVWREDGRQCQQRLAADGVSLHCEEPSLVVIEQQSAFFRASSESPRSEHSGTR